MPSSKLLVDTECTAARLELFGPLVPLLKTAGLQVEELQVIIGMHC